MGLRSGHPKRKRKPGGQTPPRRQSESPAANGPSKLVESGASFFSESTKNSSEEGFSAPGLLGTPALGTTLPQAYIQKDGTKGSSGTEETPESKRKWRSQEGTRCRRWHGRGSTQFTGTMKSTNDHSQQTHTDTAQTRHRKGPEPGCSEKKGCECYIINTGLGLVGAGRGAGNTRSRLLLGKGLV